MGGAAAARPETNAERNARILAGKRSAKDISALNAQAAYLARSRRRGPLFGGPESGKAPGPSMLGGIGSKLGIG